MGKATVPGNTAVGGISGTSTTKPTTSVNSSSGTSSTSSGSGTGATSSGSTRTSTSGRSTANSNTEATQPYDQTFYTALANGVPAAGNIAEQMAAAKAAAAAAGIISGAAASVPQSNVAPVNYVDISRQRQQLATQEAQAKQQANATIDYSTAQSINELSRNLEDSKVLYQTQRNQVDADEARALDNQALYAEARGDKGGIGQAQYGAIQNTAAVNRQTVNSAEVKLQTDTARQISDLRAKGEYEKADKMMEIGNQYLSKLTELEKWAQEQNVGVEEFNAKLSEWQQEYLLSASKYLTDTELKAAELYGVGSTGATTADYRNTVNKRYADSAKAMINAGIVPTEEQLSAMGWTPEEYWVWMMGQKSNSF